MSKPKCSKGNCDKPNHAKTFCLNHYMVHYRSQQTKKRRPYNHRITKLVAKAKENERKRIIRKLQNLPIHLVRWEVINYIEGTK